MLPDIPGHNITINDIDQVLNMGGPWVGKLYIDHKLVCNGCVVDNLIYEPENNQLFYVQYHRHGNRLADCYFTVGILNLSSGLIIQSVRHFPAVHILQATADQVSIVLAFHDQNLSTQQVLELQDDFTD